MSTRAINQDSSKKHRQGPFCSCNMYALRAGGHLRPGTGNSKLETRNWPLYHSFMDDCLFCKIIAGKIPSKKVYEDDKVFVFEDINPKAPTHVLIIPKRHLVDLKEA